jgi:hypothetical protein
LQERRYDSIGGYLSVSLGKPATGRGYDGRVGTGEGLTVKLVRYTDVAAWEQAMRARSRMLMFSQLSFN